MRVTKNINMNSKLAGTMSFKSWFIFDISGGDRNGGYSGGGGYIRSEQDGEMESGKKLVEFSWERVSQHLINMSINVINGCV